MTAAHQPSQVNQAALTPSSSAGVADRLRRLFLEGLSIEVPSAEADIIEAGLLDSLGLVELLFRIEREFKLTIPLDQLDIDQFRTLRSIEEFVVSAPRLTIDTSQP